MATTIKERKCRNAGHDICKFLVTCFCGLDVLMVDFISEDLNYIAKKVLYVFLALKYSEVINSSICMYLPLLSLSVNSVQIFCDSISNLLNSDHHLAVHHCIMDPASQEMYAFSTVGDF